MQLQPEALASRHVAVARVPIFDGAMRDVLDVCHSWLAAGIGARVATANLDFLALARRDATLLGDLRSSHMVVADGMPVALLGRLAGGGSVRRAAGVDLVQELLSSHELRELRVVMYGGRDDLSARAAALMAQQPRVTIAGRIVPPFRALTPAEEIEDMERIGAARPHVVLVALGCPRQERVIARYFDAAPDAIWIGVGGTFELIAGAKRRAPRWAQRTGLEWLVRLAQDPARLWRRYLMRDVPALGSIAAGVAVGALRGRGAR
jgi:N-acetylglucosaminyldiphosphoundecaprenol N-acetyl-beta-D-mannosaminyltransferase